MTEHRAWGLYLQTQAALGRSAVGLGSTELGAQGVWWLRSTHTKKGMSRTSVSFLGLVAKSGRTWMTLFMMLRR